jgi:phosphatidate cytidylyltransferase
MKSRVLTALALVPAIGYIAGWAPWWLFYAALLVFAEGSLREYLALCRPAGHTPSAGVGYAGVLLLLSVCEAEVRRRADPAEAGFWVVAALLVILVVVMVVELFRSQDLRRYLTAAACLLFGVVYVGLPFAVLIPLHAAGQAVSGRPWGVLFFLFLVVWGGDIFAYFGGRLFGRTPLFPRVSPRKTVEGAAAGLTGSILAGWVFTHWFWSPQPTGRILATAGLVAVAGQVGDLAESALKRGANVKDSGTVLPGHGGFLDRVDSLLFGAPVLWIALKLWGAAGW